MRNLKSILVVAFVSLFITSCSESNDPVIAPVEAKTVSNIYAPLNIDYTTVPGQAAEFGEFTKFSFKTGSIVTNNNWDIAFRGPNIIVNGGNKIGLNDEPERTANAALTMQTGTFESFLNAPAASNFKQDAVDTYALPMWYTYAGRPSHAIYPTAGKVIIVKTHDNHYAKMEILSYYKDQDTSNSADPQNSGGQHYTFKYVYNPNAGDTSLE